MIHCSNDPLLGGDPALHNPEDMLIAALSACHMLWFLHLASDAGIVVTGYEDDPLAVGETDAQGASRFLRATLRPRITVAPGSDLKRADALHARVHDYCFIARSVNFPVDYKAGIASRVSICGTMKRRAALHPLALLPPAPNRGP